MKTGTTLCFINCRIIEESDARAVHIEQLIHVHPFVNHRRMWVPAGVWERHVNNHGKLSGTGISVDTNWICDNNKWEWVN